MKSLRETAKKAVKAAKSTAESGSPFEMKIINGLAFLVQSRSLFKQRSKTGHGTHTGGWGHLEQTIKFNRIEKHASS